LRRTAACVLWQRVEMRVRALSGSLRLDDRQLGSNVSQITLGTDRRLNAQNSQFCAYQAYVNDSAI
jgi:hypothetical protein